ncbi:MAG: hypothetical protein AAGJ34_00495 [Pseudomonadota bacterium]
MAASAVTYVSLRTLNSFLSTAQEIEVGGAFVVQGTAKPLKVLEPIDDTVERVAGVVFVISGLAAILTVSFAPIASLGFGALGLGFLLCAAKASWSEHLWRPLLRYGLMLGCILPVIFVFAGYLGDRMTKKVWEEHAIVVETISSQIQANDPQAEILKDGGGSASPDTWGTLLLERTRETFEVLSNYGSAAGIILNESDRLIESFFNIMAVFFFKIVILPLLLYGAYLAIMRKL